MYLRAAAKFVPVQVSPSTTLCASFPTFLLSFQILKKSLQHILVCGRVPAKHKGLDPMRRQITVTSQPINLGKNLQLREHQLVG